MPNHSRRLTGLSGLVLATSLASPAAAYDLKPIVIQLAPSGARSAQTAVITNTHDVPIAIEVKTFQRKQNPDGSDTLTIDDENLIISPPQMVIAPKSSQSFRVQWVGDAAPKKEIAYRIVTEQLPIQFKERVRSDLTADVTMRYRYEAALYIMPEERSAKATLASVAAVKSEDGTDQLELHIRSEGTSRAILDKPTLDLAADGRSLRLEGEAVKPLIGLNILPDTERVVRIAMPAELKGRVVSGTLSTRYITLN
jgi:fimbrial chaperone protein